MHIHSNVLFILTKANNIDIGTDRLFLTLKDLNKILLIDLKPFSKRDIALIIKKNFSQKNITDEEIDEIFEKSKGNAFFLKEYIELFKKNKKNNNKKKAGRSGNPMKRKQQEAEALAAQKARQGAAFGQQAQQQEDLDLSKMNLPKGFEKFLQ